MRLYRDKGLQKVSDLRMMQQCADSDCQSDCHIFTVGKMLFKMNSST